MGRKCVNDENVCEIHRDNVNYEKCTCNDLKVMCNLVVTASIIAYTGDLIPGTSGHTLLSSLSSNLFDAQSSIRTLLVIWNYT